MEDLTYGHKMLGPAIIIDKNRYEAYCRVEKMWSELILFLFVTKSSSCILPVVKNH